MKKLFLTRWFILLAETTYSRVVNKMTERWRLTFIYCERLGRLVSKLSLFGGAKRKTREHHHVHSVRYPFG